jgi:hypothetical protein
VNVRLATAPRVAEVHGVTPERFAAEIAPGYRPVIMRGLVAHWPAVAAGRGGPEAMADYLLRHDGGRPASVMIGPPAIGGRFFYRDDLQGFNFQSAKVTLPVLLQQLLAQKDQAEVPALYAGAAAAAEQVPGWTAANPLPLATPDAVPRIWLGNASRVSIHYDISSNVAAVVAGRRRFALFPPEQGRNLYVGPLDVTIAGQPTSMVDLEAPDLDRYPRFAEALDAMQVAELEPGDALFVPSLWWHEVRAEGQLNVLVNYWWGKPAATSPFPALIHAMMAIRDLPAAERAALRDWFDQYAFGDDARAAADHLPAGARGVLGPATPARDAAIREYLMRALTRE